jgi:tRNA(fMet)-specific endonuclease VapC
MSGKHYLLDTNAILVLLQSKPQLVQLPQNANWAGILVISQIELLVFSGLSQADRILLNQFIQQIEFIVLGIEKTSLN